MPDATPGEPRTPTHSRGARTPASRVVVRGATLAGIAAALRLAKAGHEVTLDAAGVPFAGHWGAHPATGHDDTGHDDTGHDDTGHDDTGHDDGDGDGGIVPDELPQTFTLRAAWMDLFKKSGRAFEAEMARASLQLAPAPATRHVFADGRVLDLPAERGAQFHAVAGQFGREAATRWSELLDRGDEVWFALRMCGLERPVPAGWTRQQKQALWAGRSLDDLARDVREPHLAAIVRSLGPLAGAPDAGAPALLLSRAVVERQFGRWQVLDADGGPQPAGALLGLLRERLATRRVRLVDDPAEAPAQPDAVLLATPRLPEGWLSRRRTGPALAPAVRHAIAALPEGLAADGITRIVDHSAGLPVESWWRPLGDGSAALLEHDHTRRIPNLHWGLAPSSWRSLTDRTPMRASGHERTWQASASSFGGNEPWAELLSAALAVYDLHEQLTGADIRPTNRAAGRSTARPGSRPTAASG